MKKITEKYSGEYFSAPVGEINVVEKMKAVKADIGGEGNGGVIFPSTHYGRDSLIGIGLILTLLAERNLKLSELKQILPEYYIHKSKTKFSGSLEKVVESLTIYLSSGLLPVLLPVFTNKAPFEAISPS